MGWGDHPYAAWNADQTLSTAMQSSVNWYFQSIDRQLGRSRIHDYIREIGYGNKDMNGDLSSYWLGASLKISPIEQVELLTKLYHNRFGFEQEHIDAVKDALRISVSGSGTLYGKTGTGLVNGKSVSGWFVGYVETNDNTYFFAIDIKADDAADGSSAAQIALSVLSALDIWNE